MTAVLLITIEIRRNAGFEMLVNNFSVGILGMLLAILGYYVIGPFMTPSSPC